MGLVLLTAREAHVVHAVEQLLADVAIVLRGRLATDVGARGDEGFLETIAQLVRERLLRDAQGYRTIGGYEVWREIHRSVEDDGGWFHGQVEQVPCHRRHVADVALEARVAVDKADEGLGVVTVLNLVNFCHGFGVGGVAADAPNRVGGVKNHAAIPQDLDGVFNVFFLCHNRF